MEPLQLFESVPNFSEGMRTEAIAEIAGAAAHAHVLDVDADPDHNRVVISLAGQGPEVASGLVASVRAATAQIDLRQHRGVHPRVGVADVLPIVPLGKANLEDARALSKVVGERIWNELRVPVYFYGYGEELTLADIRGGRGAGTARRGGRPAAGDRTVPRIRRAPGCPRSVARGASSRCRCPTRRGALRGARR